MQEGNVVHFIEITMARALFITRAGYIGLFTQFSVGAPTLPPGSRQLYITTGGL